MGGFMSLKIMPWLYVLTGHFSAYMPTSPIQPYTETHDIAFKGLLGKITGADSDQMYHKASQGSCTDLIVICNRIACFVVTTFGINKNEPSQVNLCP